MNYMTFFQAATLAVCGFGVPLTAGAQTNALSIYPAVELEYPMTNGGLYQLQAADTLPGDWSNAGPAVLGQVGAESFCQSIRGAGRKFWRVVQGSSSNVMDFSRARSLTITNYVLFENVQWQGTNYQLLFRIGNALHPTELTPLKTFQIPTATITLDGNPADWSAIPVLYSDPAHDQSPPDNHPGTDVQQVKIARDATNLYMAYWLHDANPPQDGTFYLTELQLYLNQMHTPGDTMITAGYSPADAEWQVQVNHREQISGGVKYGAANVGVGAKFIEYRIPIADIEYDGGGMLSKIGIEGRFIRTYAHYVHNANPSDPLSTYDGAGEDAKVMIVKFY
jgi:hypothetical protein